MKYILTYNEQFNQDLLYMFPDLQVKYYIGDVDKDGCKPWSTLEEEDWQDTSLIICDSKINQDKYNKRIKEFCSSGQYIWGYEFVKKLDADLLKSYVRDRELIVWGVGNTLKVFSEKYNYPIDMYVDTKSQNESVLSPNQVNDWKQKFVIVTSIYFEEISKELKQYGLEEYKDFISCFDIWQLPSDLFMSMQGAKKYYNIKCQDPFSVIKVTGNGDVFPCVCENWILKTGNIIGQDYQEIESGIYTKLVQLSIVNRTYYFCNKKDDGCGLFDSQLYPNGTCKTDETRLDVSGNMRKKLVAAFDESCNLMCESCRNKYITKSENILLPKIEKEIENKILPHMRGAIIASTGEFFLSEYYRKLVSSPNFKSIDKLLIITNGLLCNRKNWELLREVYDGEVQMLVSIDAASQEIYKKIRRGDFDKLLTSLEFIKSLRKQEQIKWLGINFVIQKANVNDMVPFVELGEKMGVDQIYFGLLRNWGTFSDTEFEERNMFIGESREPKEELLDIKERCCAKSNKINWLKINENFRIWRFHENGMDEFK